MGRDGIYRVDYVYREPYHRLGADIYIDNTLYKTFDSLPVTKTHNPTKSQAKELITKARKNETEEK